MHKDNIRFLYSEYKNCLRNEFKASLSRDDEYKSYLGRCEKQRQDIQDYLGVIISKAKTIRQTREEDEISFKTQTQYFKYGRHGWNAQQIKNFVLNYDKSKEEFDTWTNYISKQEDEADWGYNRPYQLDNIVIRTERSLLRKLTDKEPESIWTKYKWTGKPTDDWNRWEETHKVQII